MVTKETKNKILKQLNNMVIELDVNIHTKTNPIEKDYELFYSILNVFNQVNEKY